MPTLILGKDYLITFIDHLDTKTGDVIYKKPTEGEYIHIIKSCLITSIASLSSCDFYQVSVFDCTMSKPIIDMSVACTRWSSPCLLMKRSIMPLHAV